eukprot:scaffold637_cov118-Isochrysis_galbana.AAC.23
MPGGAWSAASMRFCDSTFTHIYMCAHAAGRCSIRHRVAAPSSQHFLIPPFARATSPMSRRRATAEPYRELVPQPSLSASPRHNWRRKSRRSD